VQLLQHFDHWDIGYPAENAYLDDHFCLVTCNAQYIRLVTAQPWVIRSECGVLDRYWKTLEGMTVYHHDHRDLKDTDLRVVSWISTKDPMLTPFEMSERLEQQERELAYLRARVYQLLAEMERDEEERAQR
jgi:hypothetical protein